MDKNSLCCFMGDYTKSVEYGFFFANTAHAIRAILFAKATIALQGCIRVNRLLTHRLSLSVLLTHHCMTVLAP